MIEISTAIKKDHETLEFEAQILNDTFNAYHKASLAALSKSASLLEADRKSDLVIDLMDHGVH